MEERRRQREDGSVLHSEDAGPEVILASHSACKKWVVKQKLKCVAKISAMLHFSTKCHKVLEPSQSNGLYVNTSVFWCSLKPQQVGYGVVFTKDTPDDASDSVLSVTFRGMKTDVLISSVSLVSVQRSLEAALVVHLPIDRLLRHSSLLRVDADARFVQEGVSLESAGPCSDK
ncbi:hypothetical protein H671_5g13687 [Cricetulus griseus]|uniref:Uncharacterized protein n=1 Tax=Cricetulus griseus TaxID=10029 RepID=A0A061I1F8_CRIGR|nr:hypothetical protein H671_5g13687 [Cricetulus griseus]